MAINIADNSPRVNYTATSGQTVFTVSFEFFEDADLSVYINGTEKTITTHYTVSGGDGSTGTVTLTSGATAGDKVAIVRDVSLQRTSDFTEGAAISRAALNEQLDIITAQIADVDDKASRALQLNDHEVAVSITLPATDDRKGKILGFNASTGAVEAGPTLADTQSLADVSADIATLADIEDGTDATDAIQTVAGISSNVSTVAGISGNVTTVAGISSNVTAVAGDATDIGTVASNISSVNTVATNIADVITVANDLNEAVSEVVTVADDLNEAVSEIDTVANSITNVNTVGTNISNVNTVAGISSNVTTVAGVSANVTTVADNITNVNTVATNISTISAKVSKSGDIMTGNLSFGTSKALFGSRSNLEIFHNATPITATNLKIFFTNGSTSGTMEITDSDHSVSVSDTVRVDSSEVLNWSILDIAGVDKSSLKKDLTVSAATSTTFTVPITYTSDPGSSGTLEQAGTYYYYAGSASSYISDQGAGSLNILGSEINIFNDAETALLAQFNTTATKLFHNNSEKLATTSTGIDVTGTVTADGLTVEGSDFVLANFERTAAGGGTAVQITNGDDNAWQISSGGDETYALRYLASGGSAVKYFQASSGGDISFYEDTGTTAKFFWDASAESLGIGTATVNADLHLGAASPHIDIGPSAGNRGKVGFDSNNVYIGSTSGTGEIHFKNNIGSTDAPHSSGDTKMVITDSGVGIGTSSPSFNSGTGLEISRSGTASLRVERTGATASSGEFFAGNGQVVVNSVSNTPLIFRTNNTDRMTIDSSGNVGIKTSSPAADLHIYDSSADCNLVIQSGGGNSQIGFGDNANNYTGKITYNHTSDYMMFQVNQAERMRIDSSGNLLVGKTAPNIGVAGAEIKPNGNFASTANGDWAALFNRLTSDGDIVQFRKDGTTVGSIASRSGVVSSIVLDPRNPTFEGAGLSGGSFDSSTALILPTDGAGSLSDGALDLGGSSNRFRNLYLSGGVLDGTTTGYSFISGGSATNNGSNIFLYGGSHASTANTTIFRNGSSETMRIDSSGNVGIGTTTVGQIFTTDVGLTVDSGNAYSGIHFTDGATSGALAQGYSTTYLYNRANGSMLFGTNDTERMRIDSSGNLLVGKTALNTDTTGLQLESDGYLSACRDGGNVALINRKTSDGALVTFQKDGFTVGSIASGPFSISAAGVNNTGWSFGDNSAIEPMKNQATADNLVDLGSSSKRMDDIHATNGTIQTSDRNEKQDIAELTDAEQRVAVAAKGLLRKFRWKDKVAEKGDEARTHFGIIAQDLQAAFAAEGLDAGDYAMFIHSTWTDEETGEERSRMGVRYSELLAFIIAAI